MHYGSLGFFFFFSEVSKAEHHVSTFLLSLRYQEAQSIKKGTAWKGTGDYTLLGASFLKLIPPVPFCSCFYKKEKQTATITKTNIRKAKRIHLSREKRKSVMSTDGYTKVSKE